MNKFDKRLIKALSFFANNNLQKINQLRKKNNKKYTKKIPKNIEEYLFENNYLDADNRRKMGITPIGLEQLRTLESVKLNQKTFWLSITALIISLITFLIQYYPKGGVN